MECRREQRAVIKSCVKWGFDPKRTINSLRAAFDNHTLSHTQIRYWFKRFMQDSNQGTADSKRPGRPKSKWTDEEILKVRQELESDRRSTVRQLAEGVDMSHTSVHTVIKKDLKMKKLAAKFVPRVLTEDQKKTRLNVATANLDWISKDNSILNRIIATDESWVFTYNPRTKVSDMQWTHSDEPHPRKALHAQSQKKTMLILYFDCQGVILADFHDEGTVTKKVYVQSLKRMREAVRRKRPHLWGPPRSFILLQDNASPHTADITVEYMDKVEIETWPHPPYSPDMSPCDFWAFPRLKKCIHSHHFQSLDDIKVCVR